MRYRMHSAMALLNRTPCHDSPLKLPAAWLYARALRPVTERLRADYFAALMQEAASAVPVVTYSLYNRDADVCVERLRLNMEETQVPDARWHVSGDQSMLDMPGHACILY